MPTILAVHEKVISAVQAVSQEQVRGARGLSLQQVLSAIYWLKKQFLIPSLTFSSGLISRFEGLYADLLVSFVVC